MSQIYLDYAAATPLDDDVLAAMRPFFFEQFYNPSATYLAAKAVRAEFEHARNDVAQLLGARSTEVIFTAGATEANNLAIRGVMVKYPSKKMLVSSIEHESVLTPARGFVSVEVPVKPDGAIDLTGLTAIIDDDTVLLSVMYANNEVGTIEPLKEIAAIVGKVRLDRRKAGSTLPLYLHTDAAQAGNYLDLHVSRLGVDLMTLNGGKIYGPKQTGVLYIRTGVQLEPLISGGGQERNLRSGTENVAGAIGLSTALMKTQTMKEGESRRLRTLQALFFDLLAEKMPTAILNGSRKRRLPNNVHVTFPGNDNERVLMALDEAGILAAAGSACSASDDEPSHVLKAMGLSDKDARASIRFTMGRGTTERDVRHTVDVLVQLIA